ncbi:hypothetical protein M3D15_03505 [Pseudoclavibacter alba]|uniref:Uncharacterized protein n=1 Tax=Pseudoclavibacter albus TaxID=272241 RepID=A0ABT2HVQ6_9MICO|nr:hypothetical protein [Pseudoclavibacter alba]MCT2042404.1 hypothetical protein [Pseudoclavibacter alba]
MLTPSIAAALFEFATDRAAAPLQIEGAHFVLVAPDPGSAPLLLLVRTRIHRRDSLSNGFLPADFERARTAAATYGHTPGFLLAAHAPNDQEVLLIATTLDTLEAAAAEAHTEWAKPKKDGGIQLSYGTAGRAALARDGRITHVTVSTRASGNLL